MGIQRNFHMMSFAVDEVSNKDDEGRARLGITYDV